MTKEPRFRDHSNLALEIFIATLTALPILVLIYFYPILPDQVPEYLNLNGEVEVWGRKGFFSVFRLPLIGIDLQVLCLLTKYATWQSSLMPNAIEDSPAFAGYRNESLKLTIRLLDWFRVFAAIKLCVSSLEVVFFGIERFHFLINATRFTSWAASIMGVIAAIFYSYRWFTISRKLKLAGLKTRIRRQTDSSHLHGGIFYYNPSDPSWFSANYLPNFGNKWVYIFLVCLLCLPLLMFGPMLNS